MIHFLQQKQHKKQPRARRVLNRHLPLKKSENADSYITWWRQIGQVLTVYREYLQIKLDNEYAIIRE